MHKQELGWLRQSLTADRTTGVRYPAKTKDFSSSLSVQTSSEAHLASCTMGTGGSFSSKALLRE
jgi:hypothetical protein